MGQWAVSLVNQTEIIHSSVNFPPLEKFDWFETVKANFSILKEYFETLTKPSTAVTSVDDILKAPSSMLSARLGVDLAPLLKLWKSSLLLCCPECNTQQLKCPCLVTEVDCKSTDSERHSRACNDCDEQLEGAHVQHLDFFDIASKAIKVEFSPELINCFLSDFAAHTILSKLKYTDYIKTLEWHTERAIIGRPFIQSIVLKKVKQSDGDRYIYISGQLQPTANGDRYVIKLVKIVYNINLLLLINDFKLIC